jgi:hypothetical protein
VHLGEIHLLELNSGGGPRALRPGRTLEIAP